MSSDDAAWLRSRSTAFVESAALTKTVHGFWHKKLRQFLLEDRCGFCDADILEAQLAHAKKDEMQAAYDRAQFLDERHGLLQRWADCLDKLKIGAVVIPLPIKAA